jgi:hypothetical protein
MQILFAVENTKTKVDLKTGNLHQFYPGIQFKLCLS